LLSLYVINYIYVIPFVLSFSFLWFFFIKNNFLYTRLNPLANDALKNTSVLKKFNYKVLLNYSVLLLTYLFIIVVLLRGSNTSFWWNHLYLTNFNLNLVTFVLFFSLMVLVSIKHININNNVNNNDYYFSLINISVVIPLIFISNSFYNFIFILEVVSILIFYKFTVSKFWYKNINDAFNKKNLLDRFFSRNYSNVLFYQYWVNFFSTTIMLFSIINLVFMYGSTEWIFLNFINSINNNVFYFSNQFNLIFWVPLFLGFFLKIGITPLHLFKIEIYKGIPFLSIYFYTTYYFLAYFLFFSTLIYFYLNSFKIFWWLFIVVFFIIGMIYVISLLFDTNYTKAFFAYSTIANSLSFLCLLVASL
jgi:NADH:ubiquinone oxidoreductase subunit 2 (subunit N)